MSLFIDRRSLAHPEWLDQFWTDFDRQTALIRNGTLPEVLHFLFLVTLACRILKIAFRSRWAAARYVMAWAAAGTREYIHGVVLRFWRYRVLMRSQDRDFRELISHHCTKCKELHPFDATGDDEWACSGCGWKTDFSGLIGMTPGEEDDG
jgi:ribosomal protein L37AE/L43A